MGMPKKVKSKLGAYFAALPDRLINRHENEKVLGTITYATLGVVGIIMTVLNIFTHKGFLTYCTGIFAVLCFIDIVLLRWCGKFGAKISSAFFAAQILAMFTYFLISGNPDGFSAIWICMLPTADMFFWDRKRGTIVSALMLAILIALLWTPLGPAVGIYDYGPTFRMRFPVLFTAFHALAFLLETIRDFTFNELARLNKLHQEISVTDQLTQVYNREGLYDQLRKRSESRAYRKAGVVIMDIDFFKAINDTHGHTAGDVVLKDFAGIITSTLNGIVCRWGGEEFAVAYFENDVKWSDLELLRTRVADHVFVIDEAGTEVTMTISIGAFESGNGDVSCFGEWIKKADEALYRAKEEGRNRVIYY